MQHNSKPKWQKINGISLHRALFKRGLILVKSSDVDLPTITKDEFDINSQRFRVVTTRSKEDTEKKVTRLLEPMKSLKGFNLFSNVYICNIKRRKEVFIPIDIDHGKYGMYIYPWISNNTTVSAFAGFDQFVMAGCMLGASLKGILKDKQEVTLIDHRLRLDHHQVIDDIRFDESMNIYDKIQFSQLKRLSRLIRILSASGSVRIYYHLPYLDYILFALKLYINKRMTYSAFEKLCNLILVKKEEHTNKIKTIFKSHDITAIVESPFENLVTSVSDSEEYVKNILALFKINPTPICQEVSEASMVELCIRLLITNELNSQHRAVWHDFMSNLSLNIHTFEDLFRMANIIIQGVACIKSLDYKTCSILPLTEKQIQVEYAKFNKKVKTPYPAIFNMTVLDPVIPYSTSTKGTLFYFNDNDKEISSLISDEFLVKASKNITIFAQRKLSENKHKPQHQVQALHKELGSSEIQDKKSKEEYVRLDASVIQDIDEMHKGSAVERNGSPRKP